MSTFKRFRPSIESICSHGHCVEPPSSVPCAHCPLVFCLRHLVEHQTVIDNEHKRLLSSIENCRTRLKTIQFNDNRYELFQQLDEWKANMNENVEMMKNEINLTYEQYDEQFNVIKENALNDINEEDMSLKEVRSINN
jgi:arginyl-tRNA--protein-N-Asp/Glu arginylyltransferase